MKKRSTKTYLIGYRAKGISTFRTPLKPLGLVVAGLGFACFGFALIPDVALLAISPKMVLVGWVVSPLGVALLGLVGIRLNIKKKVANKIRLFKYKRGWI